MSKVDFNPTEDLKKQFAGNIIYELSVLEYCLKQMAERTQQGLSSDNNSNVLLESFLLHARNLWYFFKQKRNQNKFPKDAYAHDYADDWIDKNLCPEMPYLSKQIDEISQFLSHLSYLREEKGRPDWEVGKIFSELLSTYVSFRKSLLPERLEWFK